MKRPLALLFGIIFSIILLSVIYPADPSKSGLVDRIMKPGKRPVQTPVDTDTNYKAADIVKVDSHGKAVIWAPGEKYLYYSKPSPGSKDGQEDLWFSDLKGRHEKLQSDFKFYNIRDARWSPDGNMLSFISGISGGKTSLFVYDVRNGTVKDITPQKVNDAGVTSYDWNSDSSEVLMSLDIVNPRIEIYNLGTSKLRKLNINLRSCGGAAYYTEGSVIFSDADETGKYRIYTSDMSGKDIKPLVGGKTFRISPNKKTVAILLDGNDQDGLWMYRIETDEKKTILDKPVSNVYWLSESSNLMYSTEEDCNGMSAYKGNIYYVEENMKVTPITNVVYPLFVPSANGNRIAMTSPSFIQGDENNKGLFAGRLNK